MEDFSQWLKKEMEDRRLTVMDLSPRCLITRGGLYHYLKGRRIPDGASLRRIMDVFGIPENQWPKFELSKLGRPPQKDM